MKELKQLIQDYLKEAIIMQIATSSNNQPWACTVHFVSDENFNLYWISRTDRRHSQEIANNENVAGAIVLPHKVQQPVRGIQFEGTAGLVIDKEEAKKAMKLYVEKLKMPEARAQKIVDGEDNHVVYKVTPSRIVLFDTVNSSDNPQQELKLS